MLNFLMQRTIHFLRKLRNISPTLGIDATILESTSKSLNFPSSFSSYSGYPRGPPT
jgi:hypothetical protein